MKGSLLSLLVLFFSALHAQESVSALDYAGRDIIVPEGCSAKSAYEIFDCDGFSAQWLYLKEDMVNQGVHLQLFDQFDQQIEYAEKAKRNFYSQNELFEGVQYKLNNGTIRIVGLGKVNDQWLILIVGLETASGNEIYLSDFAQNFIKFNT